MINVMRFKARIRNLASVYHIPAQAVLQNFLMERYLERISLSRYHDHIILKGGMLIGSMVGIGSRTTMDMDTTVNHFPLTEEMIRSMFQQICAIELEDEFTFSVDHIELIRDDNEYGGFRVSLNSRFETIQTPLKIDVTAGDVITPEPICYSYPSIFENKVIEVRAYNIETILAEKVETIIRRNVLNTRLRDFYDVYILIKAFHQSIKQDVFRTALTATTRQRMSLEGLRNSESILTAIRANASMRARWERYCMEFSYADGIIFDDVISQLNHLLKDEDEKAP